MKTAFPLAIVLLTLALRSFADVELTREEAASIQGYDLDKLGSKAPQLEGKIVRLKFSYRENSVKKNDDGSISGELRIWRPSTGAIGSYYRYGGTYVTVPAEGAEWFLKLPTATTSRGTVTVIARVGKPKLDQPTAEILGREIKTDLKGSRIVW